MSFLLSLRPVVLACCCLCVLSGSPVTAGGTNDDAPTTWFVVRHADRDGDNDALTEAGKARATQLREILKPLRIAAVYSTDTERTRGTATPTATALKLPVQSYNRLSPEWFAQVKAAHKGKAVLIVGHSNTVGRIVRGLGGTDQISLGHDEYDSLFVVSTGTGPARVIRLRFGASTSE